MDARQLLLLTATLLAASQPGTVLDSDDRHTWLQVAKPGFDGKTLTCDRDADFALDLKPPQPEFTQEHAPFFHHEPAGRSWK